MSRLDTGHRIDTSKQINFSFDGQAMTAYEGDTLASALLANGVSLVGRSFKLHRPRGLLSCGYEEPNGLVQVGKGAWTEPNVRATMLPVYEGLEAFSQNAWPSLRFDLAAATGIFHRFLPAAFYYKTMMWPDWSWYEESIRSMTGLGKTPGEPDPQTYHKRNRHCDVLVVGAGPAGLAAALEAGRSGLRVMLLDQQECFGGSLLAGAGDIDGKPALEWAAEAEAELAAMPEVTLLPRTTVFGYYHHNFLGAVERINDHRAGTMAGAGPRERLWRIRARQVVLATGAIERPLVFANNDKPGIMMAHSVREYLNRYGVAPGKQILVVTNNDSAYQAAIDAHDAGVEVAGIVDTRRVHPGHWQNAALERGITLHAGYSIEKVYGGRKVSGVTLARHNGGGELGAEGPRIHCDLLAVSGGWTPTIHLYSQAGGSLDYDDRKACLVPRGNCREAVSVAGAANGDFDLPDCLNRGAAAGAQASDAISPQARIAKAYGCEEIHEQPVEAYWYTKSSRTDKQWLDFQYDVKVSDIELALRENFSSVEHVKRYTTQGMASDQGKTGNVNSLGVMAELTGQRLPDVGTTTFRPPFQPVTLGTFTGRRNGDFYAPRQILPADSWHRENGAVFVDYGWQRPDYYPLEGEDKEQAVRREVHAARNAVGIFDSSPLGKIEVRGPDAAEFLNRLYVNNVPTLKPGKARYGLMANDNGAVIDDGVFVCLREGHYLLHTTSGGAAHIGLMLEDWLAEWPDLDVRVANVTTQWANITVNGPKARDVVSRLETDIDFGAGAFPHMNLREGAINGVPGRIMRASFTGELSFEINVPARYARALWETLMDAGDQFGITPYGTEALNVMRTEKGHLIIGLDTLGNSTPVDLGFGFIVDKQPGDFIGKRSLKRPAELEDDRHQLVGIKTRDPQASLLLGGHIVLEETLSIPAESHGFLTSGCHSPTLGASVGLALVKRGRERVGEDVYVYAHGETVAATLTPLTHYDPEGGRIHV